MLKQLIFYADYYIVLTPFMSVVTVIYKQVRPQAQYFIRQECRF
jgi:hypothetical protein